MASSFLSVLPANKNRICPTICGLPASCPYGTPCRFRGSANSGACRRGQPGSYYRTEQYTTRVRYTLQREPRPILLGTSSFTATGWQGSFYPKGLRPADYLSYYAQHFDTVEIDSTFYATPNVSVVRSWNAKTPEGFLFAAKVPQEITHKRVLKDCDEEFKVFLTTMEALGEKLGPLLFQFGKFDKYAFKSLDDFLARLVPFLKRLPKEHKFAVEIRNKDWLVPKLADVLREHGVALTLIDQGWMPRPWEMKDKFDLITV